MSSDPISTGQFTQEQLFEFTYILLKNFETKKLNKELAINQLFGEIKSNEDLPKLSQKIYGLLKLNNEQDKKKIDIFVKTRFQLANENLEEFKSEFITLFSEIKEYSQEEELLLSKKLKKVITFFNNLVSRRAYRIPFQFA